MLRRSRRFLAGPNGSQRFFTVPNRSVSFRMVPFRSERFRTPWPRTTTGSLRACPSDGTEARFGLRRGAPGCGGARRIAGRPGGGYGGPAAHGTLGGRQDGIADCEHRSGPGQPTRHRGQSLQRLLAPGAGTRPSDAEVLYERSHQGGLASGRGRRHQRVLRARAGE